ncbi:MAG: immunoglobulin-like domain-containing protein, partial [Ginsengibacter sp.]
MKKRHALIFIALVSIVSSCEKDPIIRTDKNVGISTVAYYPNITLTGEVVIAVANGTSFTEPGVKAQAGGADVPVVTSGTIDTNVDGVYTLTYTATNVDGVSTAHRTVAVYTTDADAATHDLSGKYFRAATGLTATWSKIGPGVYTVLNPAGSGIGISLVVVAINPTGYTISVPDQT